MRLTPLRVLAAACLLGFAAIAPAACTSTGGGIPTISQTLDEKALYVVELAYAGALATTEAAVDSGALTGDNAAQAVTILDQVNTAVIVARQAYRAGDSLKAIGAINDAHKALGELKDILPASG